LFSYVIVRPCYSAMRWWWWCSAISLWDHATVLWDDDDDVQLYHCETMLQCYEMLMMMFSYIIVRPWYSVMRWWWWCSAISLWDHTTVLWDDDDDVQLYHCETMLQCYEMMMMMISALYWANTVSWILIKLDHQFKQQFTCRHVVLLGHIILISRQSVFPLIYRWCILGV
jgi:hypothetical protein